VAPSTKLIPNLYLVIVYRVRISNINIID